PRRAFYWLFCLRVGELTMGTEHFRNPVAEHGASPGEYEKFVSRLFCQPINENTTKNIFFCPDFLRLLPQPPRKAARCFLHGIFCPNCKGCAPFRGAGEIDEGKMILMKIGEPCKMEKQFFSTKVQIFLGLTESPTWSNPFAFRCRS